jgi:hypothetical protein
MNKAVRLLTVLTVSGCGDLYRGVPKGDNVNVLGNQGNNG